MNQDLPAVTLSTMGSLSLNRAAALCLAPEDQLDGLRVALSYQQELKIVSVSSDSTGLFLLRNGAIAGQAPTFRVHAKMFFLVHGIIPPYATRFLVSPGDTGSLTFVLADGEDARRGKRGSPTPNRRRSRLAEPGVFEHLGLTLRLVRNRRGLTLKELSRRTTILETRLSLYEAGKYLPSLPELSVVLLALDIRAATFFYALGAVSQATAATESDDPSSIELLHGLPCPLCHTAPGGSESN